MLYWGFLGLIIRNAVSLPVASTQIALNLLLCGCFPAAGLTEVAITQVDLEDTGYRTCTVLRVVVLLLMTACGYGLQVLFDKQRRVEAEAREFAQRQQQLQAAGRLAAEVAHQIKIRWPSSTTPRFPCNGP